MKKKHILSLLLLLLFCNSIVNSQSKCVDDPTVKKYSGKTVDVQFTSMCAALALYKCECESGNLNAKGVAGVKLNIEYVASNLISAYKNKLTTAGENDKTLWRPVNCIVGKEKNTENNNSNSALSELNKSGNKKLIAYGTGIIVGAMMLEALTSGIEPVAEYRDELPESYSLDSYDNYSNELNANALTGYGSKQVLFAEKWVKSNSEGRDGVVFFAGEFNGYWRNGIPIKGNFSNSSINPKVILNFNIDSVNYFVDDGSVFLKYKKMNGKSLIYLGFDDSKSSIYNSNFNFIFCPNSLDTIYYTESFGETGKLTKRNLMSNYFSYFGLFNDLNNSENIKIEISNGTKVMYSVFDPVYESSSNSTNELKYIDTVKYVFPNGDYYLFKKKNKICFDKTTLNIDEILDEGLYYDFELNSIHKGVRNYYNENIKNINANNNYFILLFWEIIYNSTIPNKMRNELINIALSLNVDVKNSQFKKLLLREQMILNSTSKSTLEYYSSMNFKTRFRKQIKRLSETKFNK